jgi:hypothetical protein
MAASRSVEVTDKEISQIKINIVPKNTKDLYKSTKTIIRLRLGDIIGNIYIWDLYNLYTIFILLGIYIQDLVKMKVKSYITETRKTIIRS